MKRFLILVLAGILMLSACSGAEEENIIEAHEYWARAAAKDGNSAVYMILHNHTDVDDELIGASTDVATAVEMHESQLDANGIAQMTQLVSIPFAVDEELELKPGGLHIMLIGLKQDLNIADEFTLTLYFKNYGDVVLTIPVLDGPGTDEHTH